MTVVDESSFRHGYLIAKAVVAQQGEASVDTALGTRISMNEV